MPASTDDYYYLGQSAARLHSALDAFRPADSVAKLDVHYLVDLPQSYLKPLFSDQPDDWQTVAMAADDLRAIVFRLEAKGLATTLCLGNRLGTAISAASRDSSSSLELNDCCFGWRAYDLGIVLWGLRENPRRSADELWAAFLEGYRSGHELAPVEEAAAPVFSAIHHIWLQAQETQRLDASDGVGLSADGFAPQLALLRTMMDVALSIDFGAL